MAALDAAGDTDHVTGLLRRIGERGSGADRQRTLWASAQGSTGFTEALADATLADTEPATRSATPASAGSPGRRCPPSAAQPTGHIARAPT
jgi:hypothetical protein